MAKRATTTSPIGPNNHLGGRGRGAGGRGTSRAPRPAPRAPHARFGLTLIEVLISLAILSIGQVIVMQGLARGAHALAAARYRSTAYTFASAKLADLELSQQQGAEARLSGRFGSGQETFNWRVDAVPQEDQPGLELVTLTVDWRQGQHAYAQRFSTMRRAAEKPTE